MIYFIELTAGQVKWTNFGMGAISGSSRLRGAQQIGEGIVADRTRSKIANQAGRTGLEQKQNSRLGRGKG